MKSAFLTDRCLTQRSIDARTKALNARELRVCPGCSKEILSNKGAYHSHLRACTTDRSERLFWAKVDKTGSCWLYTGFRKWDGYGWLCRSGRYMTAHRYAWSLKHGMPAAGVQILHKCDVPACCNPDHLFLGTHAENHADKRAKKRHVFGERSRKSHLTAAQVREIKRDFRRTSYQKTNARELAARYNVSRAVILAIARGDSWNLDTEAPILHPDRVRPRRAA